MNILILCALLIGMTALLWIAKKVQDLFEKDLDNAIEQHNSYFAALNRAGYLIGFGIASLGAYRSHNGRLDLLWLIAEIVQILVYVLLADKVTVRYLLAGMNMRKHQYLSTGLVVFGVNLSTGIIAFGAFSGTGGEWYNPLTFFILGQLTLLIVARLYQFVIIKDWHLVEALQDKNIGSGLMLMSSLLSISLIVAGATSGDSLGFKMDLVAYSESIMTGIVMILVVLIFIIDWLFLPNTTIRHEISIDKQAAPVAMVALLKIFFAACIAVSI